MRKNLKGKENERLEKLRGNAWEKEEKYRGRK